MKSLRLPSSWFIAAAMTLTLLATARGAEETNNIKFSDPSKPGTVKLQLARGDLRIEGADTQEVTVRSEAQAATNKPRPDGLRVLTASTSYSLTEKDNVITLDAMSDGWVGSSSRFKLTVPRNTNIVVQNSFGGDVTCSGVAGDLEINGINGKVTLTDVSGGVLVQTMNGQVRADITRLSENKPLSFTSMNGEVQLRVPESAKANVRIRTQNGSVLTDFPETALVTKTENSKSGQSHGGAGGGILPAEARNALREAGRVGAEAAREVAEAMREAAVAAREGIDAARAQEAEEPRPPRPPRPAPTPRIPKVPTMATITGGKLVTGALNGGGPEISIATMNGDVTLRKLEAKQ